MGPGDHLDNALVGSRGGGGAIGFEDTEAGPENVEDRNVVPSGFEKLHGLVGALLAPEERGPCQDSLGRDIGILLVELVGRLRETELFHQLRYQSHGDRVFWR